MIVGKIFECILLFLKLINLFIFGSIGSLLLHVGFPQLRRAGATLRYGAQASHCGGFSCCGAQALVCGPSVVVARGLSSCGSQALECRLSSCGPRAQLLRGMWDLPRPGLKPVSPALAGGFLTTVPPGKSGIYTSKKTYSKPSFALIHSLSLKHLEKPKISYQRHQELWMQLKYTHRYISSSRYLGNSETVKDIWLQN